MAFGNAVLMAYLLQKAIFNRECFWMEGLKINLMMMTFCPLNGEETIWHTNYQTNE